MNKYPHQPVMVSQVLQYLRLRPGARVLDATVGCGGHAEAILQSDEDIFLLGIDRDREALAIAGQRLARFGPRCRLRQGNFGNLAQILAEEECSTLDGALFDFGVSSLQLDRADRGFSFRQDGPLDMRMDQSSPITASHILNSADEKELTRIFRDYGEQPGSRRIARAIASRREQRPWMRTVELAELFERLLGRPGRRSGPPPPTRCFQALRIAVNRELPEIEVGLQAAVASLAVGGRIVAISFHSLEDRIVKNIFREAARTCVCPPDFPECRCDQQPTLRPLTRRPLRPEPEEVATNRRAAPSLLRAAEKIAPHSI